MKDPLVLGGISIQRIGREEAIQSVLEAAACRPVRVAWVYANCVNIARHDQDYLRALQRSDFVLNDGVGIEIAGIVMKRRVTENLCGTDLIPTFLDKLAASDSPLNRIFLLGSEQSTLEDAAKNFKDRWPGLTLVGAASGFFSDPQAVVRTVAHSRAQVLVLGLGVPKQETFVDDHWPALVAGGIRLSLAGGAIIDHLGGAVSRAPEWMRRARLEWSYRLLSEPGRLGQRYILGIPLFLGHLISERLVPGQRK